MDYQLRPVEKGDYDRIAELINQSESVPTTALAVGMGLEKGMKDRHFTAWVAERADGLPVGYATVRHAFWLDAQTAMARVQIDRAEQHKGLGDLLVRQVEAQAREWGYTRIDAPVRDNLPESVAFLERRGYSLAHHFFDSILNLQTAPMTEFKQAVKRAEELGYRFLTLDHFPDLDAAKRKFYEVDIECSVDEPDKADGWTPPEYDQYARDLFDPAYFDPAAVCVALKDQEWAAISGVNLRPDSDMVWTFMTGVRRPHRGQGLSLATKIATLEFAIAKGRKRAGTGNHSKNKAMLATNRRMGYEPLPGTYIMRRSLSDS